MLVYQSTDKWEEGVCLGEVLDFPGTVACGSTLREAQTMLAAALRDMAETNLLRGEPLPLPNPAVFQGAAVAPKSETVTVTLPVGGETEVKAVLGTNKVILYSWKTDKGVAYVDFHGHSPDWTNKQAFVRYLEAKDGIAQDSGSLVAPFAGEHGWYWLNIGDEPVTITLQVSGYYDEIKNYGAL